MMWRLLSVVCCTLVAAVHTIALDDDASFQPQPVLLHGGTVHPVSVNDFMDPLKVPGNLGEAETGLESFSKIFLARIQSSLGDDVPSSTDRVTQWILHVKRPFSDPHREALKEWLEARGAQLRQYLPHDAYLAEFPQQEQREGSDSVLPEILKDFFRPEDPAPGVLDVKPFTPEFKFHPSLLRTAARKTSSLEQPAEDKGEEAGNTAAFDSLFAEFRSTASQNSTGSDFKGLREKFIESASLFRQDDPEEKAPKAEDASEDANSFKLSVLLAPRFFQKKTFSAGPQTQQKNPSVFATIGNDATRRVTESSFSVSGTISSLLSRISAPFLPEQKSFAARPFKASSVDVQSLWRSSLEDDLFGSQFQSLELETKKGSPILSVRAEFHPHTSGSDKSRLREDLVRWLASRPETHWIEEAPKFRTLNRWGVAQAQNWDTDFEGMDIFAHGLTGENQIIAVGDSGLDSGHCFWFDPDNSVPIGTVNHNHRKIVHYNPFVDDRDSEAGHGSHVAASVAGKALSSISGSHGMSKFNGAAPDAKVAFYDFGDVEDPQSIFTPADLYEDYYGHSYGEPKARISSNSWGMISLGGYGLNSFVTDRFIADHPDFLVVYAAGNEGSMGTATIGIPATAKNVLTVGSAFNGVRSTTFGLTGGLVLDIPGADPLPLGLFHAAFGPLWVDAEPATRVVHALTPGDACQPIAVDLTGKVVATSFGYDCSAIEQAVYAQEAGADALFVLPDETDSEVLKQKLRGDPTIPITIPVAALLLLDDNLPSLDGLSSYFPYLTGEDLQPISLFSSIGPTSEGRQKPDIVASGDKIWSQRASGTPPAEPACDIYNHLTAMSGTSMATPIVSGSAALVRQYLQEGYFPSGAAVEDDEIDNPSAALLKAMIVHSGRTLEGHAWNHRGDEVPLTGPPSPWQGFGHISLVSVLKFGDDPVDAGTAKVIPKNLYIISPETADPGDAETTAEVSEDEVRSFCFRVDPFDPAAPGALGENLPALKATLVWTDPVGSPSAAISLVNDLDLLVQFQGKMFYGNRIHPESVDEDSLPPILDPILDRSQTSDKLNNVEQISISHDQFSGVSSAYAAVRVRGTHIPETGSSNAQEFSLIVSGNLEIADMSDCSAHGVTLPCPNDCSESGECSDSGVCVCHEGALGQDCSQRAKPLFDFVPSSAQAEPGKWMYFRYFVSEEVVEKGLGLEFVLRTVPGDYLSSPSPCLPFERGDVDPDIYIQKDRPPTWTDFHAADVSNEPLKLWAPSSVTLNPEDLKFDDMWYIGIINRCCLTSDSYLHVVMTDPRPELQSPGDPDGDSDGGNKLTGFEIAAVILIPILLIAFCFVLVAWQCPQPCCRRLQRVSASQDTEMASR